MADFGRRRVLVVGAGFAGAVCARVLAEAGYLVDVIDKRDHIAGNAYDRVSEAGVRYHVYGPHLFHTKMTHVIDWLSQFAVFAPYRHVVRAKLSNGDHVPLPINRTTVNKVFSKSLVSEHEVREFLAHISESIVRPANAAEFLYSKIGKELADIFFRPYTKKMWGLDLEDLAASVVQRIPLKYDDDDSYFDSRDAQIMPQDGYVHMFERILDKSSIRVHLSTAFDPCMLKDYYFCFNSMAIDEFYQYSEGQLPYRSIRFHHNIATKREDQFWSVTNYTDSSPNTRETAWHLLPGHVVADLGCGFYTMEEPCDYADNDFERYYPVKTSDGRYQSLYELYRTQSEKLKNIMFIGRCGTYQYLNMDQVVNQSLTRTLVWVEKDR